MGREAEKPDGVVVQRGPMEALCDSVHCVSPSWCLVWSLPWVSGYCRERCLHLPSGPVGMGMSINVHVPLQGEMWRESFHSPVVTAIGRNKNKNIWCNIDQLVSWHWTLTEWGTVFSFIFMPHSGNVSCQFAILSVFYQIFLFIFLLTTFSDLKQQFESHLISPLINKHKFHCRWEDVI